MARFDLGLGMPAGTPPSPLAPAPQKRQAIRRYNLRSKYDAAQITADNRRHLANADGLGARSANSLAVRMRLRQFARYEWQNNGYLVGALQTIANDMIGPGPRLQVLTADATFNRAVERLYREWAEEVDLAEDLREMVVSKKVNGEGIALHITDEALESPVKLDLNTVETDQVSTPEINLDNPVDGIELNGLGRPAYYHVLKEHPGDALLTWGSDYERVPARLIRFWYRRDRAGQLRGIPEITATLPLFAQHRRFGIATLTAAETAALFAALLKVNGNAYTGEIELAEDFEEMELTRGMMTALPPGYDVQQLQAQHPNATYESFERQTLKQVGRPLGTPLNVISGDSSGYNFSSARLDSIIYRGGIRVERSHCVSKVLRPIFLAWLREAATIPRFLPAMPEGVTVTNMPFAFTFTGFPFIDPLKDAKAETERLTNGTASLADVCGESGRDWEDVLRQRAVERKREIELAKELGLPDDWNRSAKASAPPSEPVAQPQDDVQPDEPPDDEEEDLDTEGREAA